MAPTTSQKREEIGLSPTWFKTNPVTSGHNYRNSKHHQMTSFKHYKIKVELDQFIRTEKDLPGAQVIS